eukprot:TRINITY_DN3296_c0_g1_i12.p1 TRINITY_DN3296_c0_g1~~TRINITY_DN3296_c0_g1_i12.p1  ORF type:complete len:350 (-),score=27.97 TRINITY_DN3296_c0_g1_i12:513-1562(-)
MQSLKKVIFVATLVLANHKVCSQLDTKTADSPEIIPTAITNQAPKLVSLAVENEQVQTTQPASSQVSTAGEASPGAPVSHQDVVTEDNPQATGTAMALLEMFQESLQAYIGAVSSPDQTTPQQADVVQSESTQEPTATASASPQPQYLLLEDQIDTVTDDSQISQQQQYTNDLVDSSVEGNTIGQSDILDDYDDATHNLETLLQGESTSVGIAGLPSVAGDLAESVAETPSGMPVRELQLREGNFSELFSGIAVELDQFEKSAALDDSYTTMYEYLGMFKFLGRRQLHLCRKTATKWPYVRNILQYTGIGTTRQPDFRFPTDPSVGVGRRSVTIHGTRLFSVVTVWFIT